MRRHIYIIATSLFPRRHNLGFNPTRDYLTNFNWRYSIKIIIKNNIGKIIALKEKKNGGTTVPPSSTFRPPVHIDTYFNYELIFACI